MKIVSDTEKTMKLPDLEMGKATIRKTQIDKNGMSYEIEEEIDVPIFNLQSEKTQSSVNRE